MSKIKFYIIFKLFILILIIVTNSCSKDTSLSPTNNTGKGGSMARFTIVGNYLYAVDKSNLKVFDIANPVNPLFTRNIANLGGEDIGSNTIETIFAYKTKLFIGSNAGFFIYDIINPEFPVYISTYEHIFSCDPVVVNDTLAFVTLRSNTECRTNSNINQLDIVNIKNLEELFLIKSYPMKNPHGLGLYRNYLFLCEAQYGVQIYDFNNLQQIKKIDSIPNIYAYDVILNEGILLLTGKDGIFQFDYSRIDSIYQISTIPVTQ